jgi:catechol 2,3-dioxygenase-like lactoylglutathione lyase family enzyme
MTPRFGFVVVYVKDIAASKRFYADVLGLRVEREAPTFIQFEHFALAADERLTGGREPEIYWLVDDAEAAERELRGKATIDPPLAQKPFGKVFGVRDPDGGTRLLLEFARSRPSQPV